MDRVPPHPSKRATARAIVHVHTGSFPICLLRVLRVTELEPLCDGQFLPTVADEACLASVDELVPRYRKVTTLHSRSPHEDSMFMGNNVSL